MALGRRHEVTGASAVSLPQVRLMTPLDMGHVSV
jgi:hypothetical protein